MLKLIQHCYQRKEQSGETPLESSYRNWRIRIFYSMYIGYALYYVTRKCLSFATPFLIADLGFSKGELGLLSTLMATTYGASKFMSGIIADKSSPRYFMSFGLIASGLCTLLFGCSSSLLLFSFFWSMNGLVQGSGWPSCTRLLTNWYSKSERGRSWSTLSTSQNIGGAITPFIVAYSAQLYGWRAAMIISGMLAIAGGLFLLFRLVDTPESLNLPPIERFRHEEAPLSRETADHSSPSAKELLLQYIIKNPVVWILACSYFCIYFIRQAIGDWSVLYLVETKGYLPLTAAAILFWFEIGGMLGGLVAGWSSDTFCSGKRGPMTIAFSVCGLLSLVVFQTNSLHCTLLDASLIFAMGFFLFGPLVLIGIAATEAVHKKAAATAAGFIGWTAYLGAAMAGYPLGQLTQLCGWQGFFFLLLTSSTLAILLACFASRASDSSIKKTQDVA